MAQSEDQQEQKFIELMTEIFQLKDAVGLDFGIYRVIHNHNQKIKLFLGDMTDTGYQPGTIQKIIDEATTEQNFEGNDFEKEIREELNEFEIDQSLPIDSAMSSVKSKYSNVSSNKEKKLYEPILNLYEAWQGTQQTQSKKSFIFSKLYEFYSQNYADGDFITQRTFTRNNDSTKRFVQTSGEDVEFHWATEGMYYIKSGDLYSDYHAKLSDGSDLIVRVDAEQLKETLEKLKKESNPDKKAMYKFGSLVKKDQAWVLTLEYVKKGATRDIEKPLKHQEIAQQTGTDESRIRTILNKYIKRNQADFFIHQNLKEELDTNLAFFIKNNVMHLDAMLADESTLAKTFKAAKAIQQIGEKINAFLGELEDFQKTLWERKKLVIETNYIISLNKLAEYGGEHLIADILASDKQSQEWRDLNLGEYGSIESVQIKDDQNAETLYLPLPVDTKHFSNDFKWQMLTAIAENTNQALDDLLDGTLFHSDNWQALNLMQEKYREQVKCTYIDPPYNTGDDGFPYKDGYMSSTWITMIHNRLSKCRSLLSADALLYTSIDKNEEQNLKQAKDLVFDKNNRLTSLIWKKKKGGGNDSRYFAIEHETVFAYAKNIHSLEKLFETYSPEYMDRYKEEDDISKFYWDTFKRKSGKQYYPIECPDGSVLEFDKDGNKISWLRSKKRFLEDKKNGEIRFVKNDDGYSVHFKQRLPKGKKPRTLIADSNVLENDGTTSKGSSLLKSYFGKDLFDNPKPVQLIQRLIGINTVNGDYVLDFFGGSGTTVDAVLRSNSDLKINLKFLMVETANYFHQLLLPRIKKLTAGLHWTDGKPNNLEGHGFFTRYHRLEQYEDSLENISEPNDLSLPFDAAASMRYLLEDASCQIKENSFDSAFNHTLNIVKGVDIEVTEVDMVESLIYLLGLKVDKLYLDGKGVIITGQTNRTQQSVTVAWRDCAKQDSVWVKSICEKHPADVVYSNQCGELALNMDAELKSLEHVFLER